MSTPENTQQQSQPVSIEIQAGIAKGLLAMGEERKAFSDWVGNSLSADNARMRECLEFISLLAKQEKKELEDFAFGTFPSKAIAQTLIIMEEAHVRGQFRDFLRPLLKAWEKGRHGLLEWIFKHRSRYGAIYGSMHSWYDAVTHEGAHEILVTQFRKMREFLEGGLPIRSGGASLPKGKVSVAVKDWFNSDLITPLEDAPLVVERPALAVKVLESLRRLTHHVEMDLAQLKDLAGPELEKDSVVATESGQANKADMTQMNPRRRGRKTKDWSPVINWIRLRRTFKTMRMTKRLLSEVIASQLKAQKPAGVEEVSKGRVERLLKEARVIWTQSGTSWVADISWK